LVGVLGVPLVGGGVLGVGGGLLGVLGMLGVLGVGGGWVLLVLVGVALWVLVLLVLVLGLGLCLGLAGGVAGVLAPVVLLVRVPWWVGGVGRLVVGRCGPGGGGACRPVGRVHLRVGVVGLVLAWVDTWCGVDLPGGGVLVGGVGVHGAGGGGGARVVRPVEARGARGVRRGGLVVVRRVLAVAARVGEGEVEGTESTVWPLQAVHWRFV